MQFGLTAYFWSFPLHVLRLRLTVYDTAQIAKLQGGAVVKPYIFILQMFFMFPFPCECNGSSC